MKTLFFLACLFASLSSYAQHPSYYLFAEQEFNGVDIYDLIQDKDLNYWFATDQGVIKHDGYTYEKVSCENKKGASVFGFVKDSKGTIYCYNLHQQIFRISKGKMELYFEIPEDMEHHELNLAVDSKDNLLIQSVGLIRIAPNKASVKIVQKHMFDDDSPVNFHMLPDGSTVSTSSTNNLLHEKDGKLTRYIAKSDGNSEHSLDLYFTWVTLNNRVYAIERKDLEVFELNTKDFTFSYVATLNQVLANQAIRVHATSDQLWLTGIGNGTYVFDANFNPMYGGKAIYQSKFISDFFNDAEGNLLLSTFDDGIIVIPNTNLLGYALPKEEKIVRVTSDGKASLFLGSNLGNIYHFKNGKLRLLYSDLLQKSNEGIKYWEEQGILVFYSSKSVQFSKWDGEKLSFLGEIEGAFKNAHFSNASLGLIAFNFGIYKVELSKGKFDFSIIEGLQKRAYCVVRDLKTNSIFAGLSSGLVLRTATGKLRSIKYKGQVVYPNSLLHHKGKTYIGTRQNGVLVYENDQQVKQIPFDEDVRKMIIHKNRLFLLSNKGLHVMRLDGSTLSKLNNSGGLSFDFIADFHILNDVLYITDSESLQYISLKKLFVQPAVIPIHFKQILVNDKIARTNKFRSDQRKIQFSFDVSTLRFRDNVKYRYRLEGYENEWQIANYYDNKITYNALPPGDYTFVVQSINGSTKSNPIRYSFNIDAPFHQKWWFYVLIFVISCLAMALVFFYRIRKMNKKNKDRLEKQKIQTEMLESELKALRSQMNPHFIFNSLNSIQDLILKEETDASYDYIVLFADLVRSTLSHSNKDFIEIDKELDFIQVYLSLEKLRFKEEFEYRIGSNGISDIKVPTLLVQPFIENALIHGLMHKEGLKTLDIEFKMEANVLTCSIRDNGVGRARSKEIQQRQGNHESFALGAIEKRLSILNRQTEYACGFVINDLMEDGRACGTEVIVSLPYKNLY